MNDEMLNEIADGMNWAADRAMTHAQPTEPVPAPKPRLKILGVWGRTKIAGPGGEAGWVRCRTTDGSCWLLRNSFDTRAMQASDFTECWTSPSVRQLVKKIQQHGSIDTSLWIRETGPEPQQTDAAAEFADANDSY